MFAECSSADQLFFEIRQSAPEVIIYNHLPLTMPWLTPAVSKAVKIIQLGIMHEVAQNEADNASNEFLDYKKAADNASNKLFDYYICPDPTLVTKNPIILTVGRLIPDFTNTHPLPDITTVGSFGFGFPDKRFELIVDQVQLEFDEALIRFHMPFCGPVDADGTRTSLVTAKRCRERLYKPGVRLEITHDFMSQTDMMEFLAKNSVNAFFHDIGTHRGISSSVEFAIAVRRPVAITKSFMFRHLWHTSPSICIEDLTLRAIMSNGITPLLPILDECSRSNYISSYEQIIAKVTKRQILDFQTPLKQSGEEVSAISP